MSMLFRACSLDMLQQRTARLVELNDITNVFLVSEWVWVVDDRYRLELAYKDALQVGVGSFAGGIVFNSSVVSTAFKEFFLSCVGENNVKLNGNCLEVNLADGKQYSIRMVKNKVYKLKRQLGESSPEYHLHIFKMQVAEMVSKGDSLQAVIKEALRLTNVQLIETVDAAQQTARDKIQVRYSQSYWYLIVSCDNLKKAHDSLTKVIARGENVFGELNKISKDLGQLLETNIAEWQDKQLKTEGQLGSLTQKIAIEKSKWDVIKKDYSAAKNNVAAAFIEFEKHNVDVGNLADESPNLNARACKFESVGELFKQDSSASEEGGDSDGCSSREDEVENETLGAMSEKRKMAHDPAGVAPVVVVNKGKRRIVELKMPITAKYLSEPITSISAISAIISLYRASNDMSVRKQLHYAFQFYALRLFEKLKLIVQDDQDTYSLVTDIRDYFMHWQFNSEDVGLAIANDLMPLEPLQKLLQQLAQNPNDEEVRGQLRDRLQSMRDKNIFKAAENLARDKRNYHAVGEYANIIREALSTLSGFNISVEQDLTRSPNMGVAAVMVYALIGESFQKLSEISKSNDINCSYTQNLLRSLYGLDDCKSFWEFCCGTKRSLGHEEQLQLDLSKVRDHSNEVNIQEILRQAEKLLIDAVQITAGFAGMMDVEDMGDSGGLDSDADREDEQPAGPPIIG